MDSVVYFVRRESDGAIKIGTSKKLYTRLHAIAKRHGRLEILGIMPGSYKEEKTIHKFFEYSKLKKGALEYFHKTPELSRFIKKQTSVDGLKKTTIVHTPRRNALALAEKIEQEATK